MQHQTAEDLWAAWGALSGQAACQPQANTLCAASTPTPAHLRCPFKQNICNTLVCFH